MFRGLLFLSVLALVPNVFGQTTVEHEVIAAGASANDGNVPANAIDGLLSTRWSALGQGVTLTLDLGAVKPISSIAIAFHKGDMRKAKFELAYSSDGVIFQKPGTTLTSSGTTLSPQTFPLVGNGRYVRIIGYGNDAALEAGWTSITEAYVYGSPVKLPIASVNASANDGNVPSNAIDGQLSTRWSAEGQGQRLILDLGSEKDVKSVSIAFYKGDTRKSKFELALSKDGVNYTAPSGILTSSGTTLAPESIPLDGRARFIRFTGFGNDSSLSLNWNSITEVAIFGIGSAAAPVPQPLPTATPAPSPAPTPAPAPAPSAISSADILSQVQAGVPFAQQGSAGMSAQVLGTSRSLTSVPESGVLGTKLPNGETIRLGKVTDPTNSSRKALAFQVSPSDPTTFGGKRSELAGAKNIELNKVYWVAYSVYVYDWGTLNSSDMSIFGTQMHSGNDTLGLSPSFSIVATGGGRNFMVSTRYGTVANTRSQTAKNFKEYPIPFGRWADFVIKFKHNYSGSGLLQVYMDGTLIADYQGPLGFNTPGYLDYVKFGYYNWTGSSFTSSRKVLLRSPIVVRDPTGSKYKPEDLRNFVRSK